MSYARPLSWPARVARPSAIRIHCATMLRSPRTPKPSAVSSTPASEPSRCARNSAIQYVSRARASAARAKLGIAPMLRDADDRLPARLVDHHGVGAMPRAHGRRRLAGHDRVFHLAQVLPPRLAHHRFSLSRTNDVSSSVPGASAR